MTAEGRGQGTCEQRWHDELAAYALGALDAPESVGMKRHLDDCEACSERARWLAPAIDILPVTVTQHDPSQALRERLMETVRAEVAAERPEPAPAPRRSWFRGLSLRPALVGAAASLLIAAGITGYALREGAGEEAARYSLAANGAGSNASGVLRVDGDSGSLHVTNLPPTENPKDVYQVWIQHGSDIQPSSVFVLSRDGSGDVAIPHSLADADRVMVTREPAGGSEIPQESPLISASFD